MTYRHNTPLGIFSDAYDYRKALVAAGYTDLGWQNGWSEKSELLWKQQKAIEPKVEDLQWNRRGSDVTYVLHESKVFCSVDMGD